MARGSEIERIAALEVQVEKLEKAVEAANSKLDDLLSFKQKGQGAFWFATTLFGTSFAAFLTYIMTWFK